MRFINLLVGLVGAATALQSVDSNAGLAAPVQVRTKAATTSTKCSSSKRFLPRGTLGGYDEATNTWSLDMNDYCEAEMVDAGQKVIVTNVSGCSPVFFFGSDGKPTVYHVEAGKEATEGKEAAKIALEQKSTASCTIYAYEQAKATALQKAFTSAGYTTVCKYVPYKLNTSNNKARWQFSLTVGSSSITPSAYTCT